MPEWAHVIVTGTDLNIMHKTPQHHTSLHGHHSSTNNSSFRRTKRISLLTLVHHRHTTEALQLRLAPRHDTAHAADTAVGDVTRG